MNLSSLSQVRLGASCANNCGYCHATSPTSHSYGIWAEQLTCQDYQDLIDRGWRRSGKYTYKPDLRKSCCPQYTIRLNTKEYAITKSQRKVLHKFNRYIQGDSNRDNGHEKPPKHKPAMKPPASWMDLIHAPEKETAQKHKLEIVLERSSCTDEKFDLYSKYQIAVHHDEPCDISRRSFQRFLVDSPLIAEQPAGARSRDFAGYGSFHQKYLLDGKLIAIAVLDILPKCVSSVYFIYDPDYAFLSLGKYSALREIALAEELSRQLDDLHWYYMGFYIHCCPKMNYKGQYCPSDLLDPETYSWFPLETCKKHLDKQKFVSFADPDRNYDESDDIRARPSGWLDTTTLGDKDLDRVPVLVRDHDDNAYIKLTALKLKPYISATDMESIKDYVAAVGHELAGRMCLL